MKQADLVFWLLAVMGLAAAGCFSATDQPADEPATVVTTAGDDTPSPQSSAVPAVPVPPVTTAVTSGAPTLRGDPQLITIGQVTGGTGVTSENITVPAGYWELWYTADPVITGGQNIRSGTGSQSARFPKLEIQVTDLETGEVIETVEPPGGLDETLWASSGDPRPWSTKFYSGTSEYNFLVTARYVESFTLEVRIRK